MASARHRRVRTPFIPQMEAVECGAACLGIVLAHFGCWRPLAELREACMVNRDGCNAADIRRAAERYGLVATGWRKRVEELEAMPKPLILFWEFTHFVVFEGVRRGRYLVNDPSMGHRSIGETEFRRAFTGVALQMVPGPEFKALSRRPGALRLLGPWLRDFKESLAYAAVCGLLLALPGLALPLLLAAFVDHVLEGRQQGWAVVLGGAMFAAGVLLYGLTWMQQRCLRHVSVQLAVQQAHRFFTRLLKLPTRYFAHRQTGDLVARLEAVDELAATASTQLAKMVIELVMSALFLVLMLSIDVLLGAAVAALAILCATLMHMASQLRLDGNQLWLREKGLLAGAETTGLLGIDHARATAMENDVLARMSGHQAREVVARQGFLELGQLIASFPVLFQILGSALVLGLGGWRVMSGEMTIGLLLGFFVVAEQFLRPVGHFVEFADRFRTLEAELLRIEDVAAAAPDPDESDQAPADPGRIATIDGRLRLAGQVRFEDVTFGYRAGHPLVSGFRLTIQPGQRIAVVGPTAAGKSTLAGLLVGLHRPWSGRILLDGHPHRDVPRQVLTRSVAFVDQRTRLFSGTIRDNLTMWNPTVSYEALVAAARDAAIHDEIMARSGDYDSPVAEGGHNFSGGQRQRLEIARALVGNPSILILDEATAALDPITEQHVDDALRRRGCTCFIVAHRLSTIRDSDLIIVLDQGREVGRGSHEELMAAPDGRYRELVESS